MLRVLVQRSLGFATRDQGARSIALAVLVAALLARAGAGVSAQVAVYDAATTARNSVTAALKEYRTRHSSNSGSRLLKWRSG